MPVMNNLIEIILLIKPYKKYIYKKFQGTFGFVPIKVPSLHIQIAGFFPGPVSTNSPSCLSFTHFPSIISPFGLKKY